MAITQDENPIGLISERDIVQKIGSKGKKPSDIATQEIITKEFCWVKPEEEA